MQNQPQQVPTIENIEAQLQQLIVQRAGAKDQIDQIEKQLPVLHGILQVLQAQKAEAEANIDA